MKKIAALTLLALLLSPCLAAAKVKPFATYAEMRQHLVQLIKDQKFTEAESVLVRALTQFPDRLTANSYNLAYVRVQLKKYGAALQSLEYGHKQGIFYGNWDFDGPAFAPLKDLKRFQAFQAKNRGFIAAAQRQARLKVEIVTPDGYDPKQKYPLFLALHGGGENLDDFRPNWHSPRLKAEFIVAYVQSTQVASMKGFHWQDLTLTAKDLAEALRQAGAGYAIDEQRMLIGGFSSGGYAALSVSLKNLLPVIGFIVLCPPLLDDVSEEEIRQAAGRGIRGTILTTELDHRLPGQRKLADDFARFGLQYQFVVTPKAGHWYPDDLDRKIDQAIAHIFGR